MEGKTLEKVAVKRRLIGLFDADGPRSKEIIVMCSWCNKVRIADKWFTIEAAIEELGLLNQAVLPKTSHSICTECREKIEKEFAPIYGGIREVPA